MVKNYRYYIGLDFSLKSPGVTRYDSQSGDFNSDNVEYFYGTEKIRKLVNTDKIHGTLFLADELVTRKYYQKINDRLNWIQSIIVDPQQTILCVEDYAYCAVSTRLVQTAETLGSIKWQLSQLDIPIIAISPKTLKKHVTGSGNAEKFVMIEHFKNEGTFNIFDHFPMIKGKTLSPIDDIVDSYFLCKHLVFQDNL